MHAAQTSSYIFGSAQNAIKYPIRMLRGSAGCFGGGLIYVSKSFAGEAGWISLTKSAVYEMVQGDAD